jgi:hypothetical protein
MVVFARLAGASDGAFSKGAAYIGGRLLHDFNVAKYHDLSKYLAIGAFKRKYHSLTGNTSGVCPECGTAISSQADTPAR